MLLRTSYPLDRACKIRNPFSENGLLISVYTLPHSRCRVLCVRARRTSPFHPLTSDLYAASPHGGIRIPRCTSRRLMADGRATRGSAAQRLACVNMREGTQECAHFASVGFRGESASENTYEFPVGAGIIWKNGEDGGIIGLLANPTPGTTNIFGITQHNAL